MTNKLQLHLEVPKRESVGGDTEPPKTNTRREYVKQIYRHFGWTIPPQWETTSTPEPQFSEPMADGSPDTPKVKRIKVKKTK